jgi:hypothetical protein
MKEFGITVLSVLCVIALVAGGIWLKILLFPVHTAIKGVDVAYGVVDKTMTAENAIYNYEWFKQQEAYIRQCYKNEEIAKEEYDGYIKALPADRSKWTRDDKQEEASLRNSYYALQKLTNKAIEDYNARSSMANRAIFKDNLPSNITRAWIAGYELIK